MFMMEIYIIHMYEYVAGEEVRGVLSCSMNAAYLAACAASVSVLVVIQMSVVVGLYKPDSPSCCSFVR